MGTKIMRPMLRYLTDDRDDTKPRNEICIMQGANGDWYIAIAPEGQGTIGKAVRICFSGGASTQCPGLGLAIHDAYEAISSSLSGKFPETVEIKESKKIFKRPELGQIIAYANEIHLTTSESEAFFDYQESKGWKVGNAAMKDFQAAMRTWKRNSEKFFKKKIGNSAQSNPYKPDEGAIWKRGDAQEIIRNMQAPHPNVHHAKMLLNRCIEEASSREAVIAYLATRLTSIQIQELK